MIQKAKNFLMSITTRLRTEGPVGITLLLVQYLLCRQLFSVPLKLIATDLVKVRREALD